LPQGIRQAPVRDYPDTEIRRFDSCEVSFRFLK
jgi:hypothetical protein